jgi:hypothetical protein
MVNDNVFFYSIDASSYKKSLILTPNRKQKIPNKIMLANVTIEFMRF